MNAIWLSLLILSYFHQISGQNSSCKTNCTTDEQCWHDALSYHSSELIEQLFSFGSLSVHVRNFQEHHPHEVVDSVAFITAAFANHLFTEATNANLSSNLFQETNKTLIELCKNLTIDAITTVDQLPRLMCPSITCASETMNNLTIFIVTVMIASLLLVVCFCETCVTYRTGNYVHRKKHRYSIIHSYSKSYGSVNTTSVQL